MEQRITARMTDEDGRPFTRTFTVERTLTVEGKTYLALVADGEEDDVYLFDFTQAADGTVELLEIEDDAAYEKAADAYEALQREDG